MDLDTAKAKIRMWYLPSDDVRLAVLAVKGEGTPNDKDYALERFVSWLREPDTGPDYDHAYQLEDGRGEMHYNELRSRNEFAIEMLRLLSHEQTRAALESLPMAAGGYSDSRPFLAELAAEQNHDA